MILDARGNPVRSTSQENERPLFEEIATIGDGRDITRPYLDEILYPIEDTILAERVQTIAGYKKLRRDYQVQATLQQRRDAVIAREWDVMPGERRGRTTKADRMAAGWLKEQLEGRWNRVVHKMLSGVFYGYGVAEVVPVREGNLICVDQIRVRDRTRFVWGKDFDIRLLTQQEPMYGEALPQANFWTFSCGSDHDDDPYGVGLAHYLYWPIYFKRNGMSYLLRFLERWAQPVPRGTYPPGTPLPEQRKLLMALNALVVDGALIHPEGLDVDLLEASRSGSAPYIDFHKVMDAAIAKIVLSQTMTTDSASTGLGSTQGEVHADVAENVQRADADLICDSFNGGTDRPGDGVAERYTRWNFPNAVPPKVRFEFEEEEDLNTRAARDEKLYAMGWELEDEKEVEEVYGAKYVRRQPGTESPGPGDGARGRGPGRGGPRYLTEDELRAAGDGQASDPTDIEVSFAERRETDLSLTPEAYAEQAMRDDRTSIDQMMGPVRKLLGEAESLEQFRDALFGLYGEMDATAFAEVLQEALLSAELAGRYEVEQEVTGEIQYD